MCRFGARPAEVIPSSRSQHRPVLKTEVDLVDRRVLIRSAKSRLPGESRPRLLPVPDDMVGLSDVRVGLGFVHEGEV